MKSLRFLVIFLCVAVFGIANVAAQNTDDLTVLIQKVRWAGAACKAHPGISICRKAIRVHERALQLVIDPDTVAILKKNIEKLKAILHGISTRSAHRRHKVPVSPSKPGKKEVKVYRSPYPDLRSAVIAGNIRSVRYFLQKGANPDAVDEENRTPLHYAAQLGQKGVKIMKLLLSENADPNIQDNQGYSPLHLAAMSGCKECVLLLLDYGADPRMKTYLRASVWDVAKGEAKPALVGFMDLSALSARINHSIGNVSVKIDGIVRASLNDKRNRVQLSLSPEYHRVELTGPQIEPYTAKVLIQPRSKVIVKAILTSPHGRYETPGSVPVNLYNPEEVALAAYHKSKWAVHMSFGISYMQLLPSISYPIGPVIDLGVGLKFGEHNNWVLLGWFPRMRFKTLGTFAFENTIGLITNSGGFMFQAGLAYPIVADFGSPSKNVGFSLGIGWNISLSEKIKIPLKFLDMDIIKVSPTWIILISTSIGITLLF